MLFMILTLKLMQVFSENHCSLLSVNQCFRDLGGDKVIVGQIFQDDITVIRRSQSA